jgi:glutathione peroxidase
MNVYDFKVKASNGQELDLSGYAGQALLIVNTASKCGFTPQFAGLEEIWQEYKDQGLTVLGFPCNQFGNQDPGTNQEITEFCQMNYGVSFPMMAKIDVNGSDADPLYQWLTSEATGVLGTKKIKWNFTKFLIDPEGNVVERLGSRDEPSKIKPDIEKVLPRQA